MSWLDSYNMSQIEQRMKEEHAALQRKLGEPARFVADPHDPRFGIGYWKAHNGGVFSYRRMANGYDRHSRIEYPADLIDLLVNVSNGD